MGYTLKLMPPKRPYRILFWIEEKEVWVLHIRRGARRAETPSQFFNFPPRFL
jgi:hypothetical protein